MLIAGISKICRQEYDNVSVIKDTSTYSLNKPTEKKYRKKRIHINVPAMWTEPLSLLRRFLFYREKGFTVRDKSTEQIRAKLLMIMVYYYFQSFPFTQSLEPIPVQ